ncbi:MAG: ferrous iron transport protein A [Pseudobutyrivibrio sp.]|jgi:ferrous iron transport protein A|uniref:Ferrous iron transport protein A n=3 Tax=Lachnospiraceae TaxID=186803 RepID=A0A2G3DXI6_9FIRM|nr:MULTISPECIES: FeoA family protein [Pseudobutyrivibrio]MBE5902920.1 ferrous iron transport protein A [Pseudobutyrivibrio sp.]MBR5951781.1 ferrous iron transport protein A [Pseudobutyrivibrio sp.]NEX02426.1 ferrous iron transport protein A [Pseudobutyrivibrio xylanivorans]PHU35575.1 ferrous iron transport protein A [Pseudobutyrivibrio ruminis]PHU41134.1 ferrous iron transport protein A [Pseudobutyrivibrio ruminis]
MMPLVVAPAGEEQLIKRIGGSEVVKRHLQELGFVPGSYVTVVSEIGGNLIVNVKESRVAVDKQLAQKIMV